ncbi:MAG: 6-phosphofructokinase [Christensenellales bacterium]|jgi:6-phosphofructokinase 1
MKRIAVLTSGGDAPGMNAAIRAVVRVGITHGMEVYGIYSGYKGMIAGDIRPIKKEEVSGISLTGGTILRTARSEEFKTRDGQKRAVKQLDKFGIQGVVAIGGDGTFQGAKALKEHGIPTIGVPGTIDNDLAYTDFTIGFDTAINTAVESISKIQDTMRSHGRIGVIEVMGRHCGDIALYTAAACGAAAVIVPEFEWSLDEVAERLRKRHEQGTEHALVIVAEGAAGAEVIARELTERTGYDIRYTVLGHVQRGGVPTVNDATLAARMGGRAVELLALGKGGRAVGIVNNHVEDFDIDQALAKDFTRHDRLYRLIHMLAM